MIKGPALFSRPVPALLFILLMLALDQAIKTAVEVYLPMQQVVPVFPSFALYRTYNLGVAFSMLSGMSGWFIVGMRLAIVVFVLWIWRRSDPGHHFAHLGFAMIIAGALGNLLDRFIYGHVIDYLLFYVGTWSFAVFNFADSLITVGAICVLIQELFGVKSAKR